MVIEVDRSKYLIQTLFIANVDREASQMDMAERENRRTLWLIFSLACAP